MDQNLRANFQITTFFYFMIVMVLTTVCQLTTMMAILFGDLNGKETLVAASIIGPTLIGAFGIIRILTNMEYLVNDMDSELKQTNYGAGISSIPFSVLKLAFSLIFVIIGIIQLTAIY